MPKHTWAHTCTAQTRAGWWVGAGCHAQVPVAVGAPVRLGLLLEEEPVAGPTLTFPGATATTSYFKCGQARPGTTVR